jgi:hypothetical protein
VAAGKLTNAPFVVGVQIGSRHEKLTVDSGSSKGVGVAAGLGEGLELSLVKGLSPASDDALGRSDGLGGTAA